MLMLRPLVSTIAAKVRPLRLPLALLLVTGLGCHPCDAESCSSLARAIFSEPGGGPLQAGEYVVEFTVDGVPAAATCEIGPGGATAKCSEPAQGSVWTPLFDSADSPHEQLWVDFQEARPATLAVRIEHDGVVVFDAEVALDYELVDEACHGDCATAIVHLDLERG